MDLSRYAKSHNLPPQKMQEAKPGIPMRACDAVLPVAKCKSILYHIELIQVLQQTTHQRLAVPIQEPADRFPA